MLLGTLQRTLCVITSGILRNGMFHSEKVQYLSNVETFSFIRGKLDCPLFLSQVNARITALCTTDLVSVS